MADNCGMSSTADASFRVSYQLIPAKTVALTEAISPPPRPASQVMPNDSNANAKAAGSAAAGSSTENVRAVTAHSFDGPASQ
jgi:hypothetical protein